MNQQSHAADRASVPVAWTHVGSTGRCRAMPYDGSRVDGLGNGVTELLAQSHEGRSCGKSYLEAASWSMLIRRMKALS